MDNKVQQLADKIYKEGIEKANSEAQTILSEAESRRDEILSDAKAEAEKIIKSAQAEADTLKQNSESELKLASLKAVEGVRTEILDLITDKAVKNGTDKGFADPAVLQSVVLKMAEGWSKNQEVSIEGEDAKALEGYFKNEANELLEQGKVKITEVNGKPHTFELSPENGSYKVTISKEAFEEYFKEFLRPRLRNLLFGSNDNER